MDLQIFETNFKIELNSIFLMFLKEIKLGADHLVEKSN